MTTGVIEEVVQKAQLARTAAARMATLSRAEKDRILLTMADAIEDRAKFILQANTRDLEQAEKHTLSSAPIDRLVLDEKRITEMAEGLRTVARLTDHFQIGVRFKDHLEARADQVIIVHQQKSNGHPGPPIGPVAPIGNVA